MRPGRDPRPGPRPPTRRPDPRPWRGTSACTYLGKQPGSGAVAASLGQSHFMAEFPHIPGTIIAHIDHGKSTLADRILESPTRSAAPDASRCSIAWIWARAGITIKAKAVRVAYTA